MQPPRPSVQNALGCLVVQERADLLDEQLKVGLDRRPVFLSGWVLRGIERVLVNDKWSLSYSLFVYFIYIYIYLSIYVCLVDSMMNCYLHGDNVKISEGQVLVPVGFRRGDGFHIRSILELGITGWWWQEHDWIIFPYDLGMSSSQLTNSYFSEGLKPPTRIKTLGTFRTSAYPSLVRNYDFCFAISPKEKWKKNMFGALRPCRNLQLWAALMEDEMAVGNETSMQVIHVIPAACVKAMLGSWLLW